MASNLFIIVGLITVPNGILEVSIINLLIFGLSQ
jgi:hypothetical protein